MFIPSVEAYLFHIILSNYQVAILVQYWYEKNYTSIVNTGIPVLWLPDPTPPYILFFQGLEVEEMETMKDVWNESLV